MINNKYIGKTNKELIIEVICKIEALEGKVTECRPVCFKNENDLIEVKQNHKNFKWVMSTIAAIITIGLNLFLWFLKKLKGGG